MSQAHGSIAIPLPRRERFEDHRLSSTRVVLVQKEQNSHTPSKLLKTNDTKEVRRQLKTRRDHERPVDGEVQVGDVANVSVKLKAGEAR